MLFARTDDERPLAPQTSKVLEAFEVFPRLVTLLPDHFFMCQPQNRLESERLGTLIVAPGSGLLPNFDRPPLSDVAIIIDLHLDQVQNSTLSEIYSV